MNGYSESNRGHGGSSFRFVAFTLPILVLVALLATSASPVEASFPGANGKLAFTSDPTGLDLEVYAMNPDGTGQADLSNNPTATRRPPGRRTGRRSPSRADAMATPRST